MITLSIHPHNSARVCKIINVRIGHSKVPIRLSSKKEVLKNNGTIIGYTSLHKSNVMLEVKEASSSTKFFVTERRPKVTVCRYCHCGGNKWIGYRRFRILLIPILVIIAIVVAVALYAHSPAKAAGEIESGININSIPDKNVTDSTSTMAHVTGETINNIDSTAKVVYLKNTEVNTGYLLRFTITNSTTGELLHKTDWVKVNEAAEWDVYDDNAIPNGATKVNYFVETVSEKDTTTVLSSVIVQGITINKNKKE